MINRSTAFRLATSTTRSLARNARDIHVVPLLRNQEHLESEGIPGLFSAKGFATAWTDYQSHVLDRLNRLCVDTDNETRVPFHILLNTAAQADQAHVFNLASQAHNNHMFFQALKSPANDNNKTRPGAQLSKRIEVMFGSFDQFRQEFLARAEQLQGNGWVFLVENEAKNLGIFSCHNAGSPYHASRLQMVDLNNSSGGEHNAVILDEIRQEVEGNFKNYNICLLALNVWEHAYLTDFGFNKREYIEKWWSAIDWDVVNSRLFTFNK